MGFFASVGFFDGVGEFAGVAVGTGVFEGGGEVKITLTLSPSGIGETIDCFLRMKIPIAEKRTITKIITTTNGIFF